MTKKEMLIDMMIAALKNAEEDYMDFTPEVPFKARQAKFERIQFVWHYWVDEGLATEIAVENFDDHFYFDDYAYFEYFLTKLAYGKSFGFSSEKVKEMLINNEVENQFKPIIQKLEEEL